MKFSGWSLISLVLLVLGVAFYLWMGLTYGRWTDMGVYAVAVVFIGFGLVGFLVSRMKPAPA